jgi:hypothetical protein
MVEKMSHWTALGWRAMREVEDLGKRMGRIYQEVMAMKVRTEEQVVTVVVGWAWTAMTDVDDVRVMDRHLDNHNWQQPS